MSDFSDYNATDLLWLGDWSPPWIAVLVMLGVVVIGVSIYDLAPLRPRRRWTLVGLRAAVYALAVMLLLEPAVDLKNVTKVKNHIAVLVDASGSMALEHDGAPRFSTAIEAVEALELPEGLEDEDHIYELFLFGDDLTEVTRGALEHVRAGQRATRLGDALESLRLRYERVDVGGVVVVTDGTDTGAIGDRTRRDEALDEATRELVRSLGGPLNTIAVASPDTLIDVAVTRVLRDDFAFVHNKVSVEAEIQVVGLEPTSFPVKLIRDGELLQTREVTVVDGETTYPVSFDYVPKSIGKEIYTIEVPEFADEVLLANNRVHFLQKVIRDKIRALQVVGRPSWDERFLRRLLKRNPNVDLISFFILRTNENVQLAPTSELSLIPFPTEELFQEELGGFDLVIFQNFNFAPYNMRQYLPQITDFVKEGGGFVMVGGDLSFASGGYAGTPIEEILPVGLPPRNASTLIDENPFRPELTDAGQRHPITQLAFDPASNTRIWSSLPEQYGTNLVMDARDKATVLATHPRITTPQGEKMPVIAVSEMGEGRVMSLTTDSTWRWGIEHLATGGTPREYQMFWNSAIRWLIKDPELKLLRVEIAEDEYAPQQMLSVTVRVQKADYTPAPNVEGKLAVSHRSFEGMLSGKADTRLVQQVTFVTDSDGVATVDVPVDAVGIWTAVGQARTPSGDLRDDDVALALSSALELRDALPRPDLLAQLAEAGGGNSLGAASVSRSALQFEPPRTVRVNRREVIQLWDSFWVFALILGLLGTEWTLRRRWGRL